MRQAALLGMTMLLGACASDTILAGVVPAVRETAGMGASGDAADDPAIWVHPTDPARSLILGTNKDAGVYVYGLNGEEKQKLLVGLSNNIDVRGNLAVASNDGRNVLSWFRIDPQTTFVSHVGDTPLATIEPYGVCIGRLDGALSVAVTYKTGLAEIWKVADPGAGAVQISQKRTLKLGSQIEGCVIDDETGLMFVGEEDVGLWSVNLLSDDMTLTQIDSVNSGTGLVADVEGVTLYRGADGAGYLIVSAQGADRYVVYDRMPPHAALAVFKVGPSPDGGVDGTSVTDGLDASAAAFPGFPDGMLVVQDDANPAPEVDQNFKIVDWREVKAVLAARSAAARN